MSSTGAGRPSFGHQDQRKIKRLIRRQPPTEEGLAARAEVEMSRERARPEAAELAAREVTSHGC